MKKTLLLIVLALALAPAMRGSDDTYESFISKKGIKSAGQSMRIYKDGDKYWMEFPDSLMGSRLILSSFLRSSSGWTSCGTDISSREVFTLGKTDSLLLFSSAVASPEVVEQFVAPIRYAFPIKYRGADSTSVVVDVSKLFSTSNKDAFNPKGVQVDAEAMVYKATPKQELTYFKDFVSFPSSTGVVQGVTFKVSPSFNVGGGMLQVVEEEMMSVDADVATVLTLMPEVKVDTKVADDRIGTVNFERNVYSASRGVIKEKILSRWDISGGKKISVYIDTLFSAAQREAVAKGLLAWNGAFEAAGLGRVVEVLPYPKDSLFSAENPLVSKVMADVHSSSGRLSVSVLADPASGHISACSITVPAGLRGTLRMEGLFGISDVDPRWREYDIPEDAFCEALTARVMQAFARVLGLSANAAGSFAYSPAQLRDPDFTRTHGITASVTDDVLFNTLARPSDAAKGVKTIVDRPGEYDYLAIEWIYGHQDAADSLLASVKDSPAYRYLEAAKDSPDPRCYSGDLGNDPFEEYENAMRRLKAISAGLVSWYEGKIPENEGFREVLAEQILLHHQAEHRKLSRVIGGIFLRDLSSGVKYESVPKDIQKKAMCTVTANLQETAYLDSNKELLSFCGAYNGFATLMRINSLNLGGVNSRLKWAALAQAEGIETYPLEDLLSDISDEVTRKLRKGSVPEGEEFFCAVWASLGLKRNIPLYSAKTKGPSDQASLYVPLKASEASYGPLLERCCAAELERLSGILKKCRRAARNAHDRNRIDYVLKSLQP